jgi:hypothetical protein
MTSAHIFDIPRRSRSFRQELWTALKVYGLVMLATLSGGLLILTLIGGYSAARSTLSRTPLTWWHSVLVDVGVFVAVAVTMYFTSLMLGLVRLLVSEFTTPEAMMNLLVKRSAVQNMNTGVVIDQTSIDEIAKAVEARLHQQPVERAKAYRDY